MPRSATDESGASSWRALLVAPVIFIILLAGLFAYSGIWPPLVVIESKSMQHSDTTSYIGTIDTGDLVVVKKVGSAADVKTYVDGIASGYSTYSEYGDVVIYYTSTLSKPIIHRAIVNLEYNQTGGGFDIPSLAKIPSSQWEVIGGDQSYLNQKGLIEIHDIGYAHVTVHLDLAALLTNFHDRHITPHGGLITMGDNNWVPSASGAVGTYDQQGLIKEPIKDSWLIGVARGEIPWFGLLKLWLTGTAPAYTPHNSERDLIVVMGVLIGLPIALDVANLFLRKRGIEMFGWTQALVPKRWRKKKEQKEKKEKRSNDSK